MQRLGLCSPFQKNTSKPFSLSVDISHSALVILVIDGCICYFAWTKTSESGYFELSMLLQPAVVVQSIGSEEDYFEMLWLWLQLAHRASPLLVWSAVTQGTVLFSALYCSMVTLCFQYRTFKHLIVMLHTVVVVVWCNWDSRLFIVLWNLRCGDCAASFGLCAVLLQPYIASIDIFRYIIQFYGILWKCP
jgi:hypothetical protein